MCGIAGYIFKRSCPFNRLESTRYLSEMARRLHHRGPDGYGIWADDHVGLAHTRLSVIDISHAGAQPMHDDRGDVHIVFNGEIYNFLPLRAELEARGHRFVSRSDTEVLIYGYKEWGTNLFSKLTGMFSLSIWDSLKRRMILARDRCGEKPLYYIHSENFFAFASEIKAITVLPGIVIRPNHDALHDYLTYGYTMGSATAFENIQRLPAAHYMVIEEGKRPVQTLYWQLPSASEQKIGNLDDLRHGVIDRLRQAVKVSMVSDVPIGAFLSGGVDSSAVVAMMHGLREGPIETFSNGLEHEDYDETKFAEMVANRYSTNHHVFNFGSSVLASINQLAWHYGEPFSDSSALVTFALAKQARKYVTVALTGDGSDELFLGYQRYFRFQQLLQENPPMHVRKLNSLYGTKPNSDHAKIASDTYGFLIERFREHQKLEAYGQAMLMKAKQCSYDRLLPLFSPNTDPLEMAGRFDVASYLADNILVKVDIATMANGLESRSPFLNHELVEYVARIPVEQRVWGGEGKALLKSSLEDYLPHEAMYRPKIGFSVPVARFLKTVASKQTSALLDCDRFADRGLIRPDYVRKLMSEHISGRHEHGTRIWTLVCLEMWFRTFIDNDGSKPLTDEDNPYAEFSASA